MLFKNKTVKIELLVTLLIGISITSTSDAEQAMEVSIIKCGAYNSSFGCGSNSPATDSLQQGYVQINNDGDVTVQLKGARANTTYTVFVGNWIRGGGWQSQFFGEGPTCGSGKAIGSIRTNGLGNFIGRITTMSGNFFSFPSGLIIGQPNFAFNNPACYPTQFTTGIAIP